MNKNEEELNFKGVVIGNGIVHPLIQRLVKMDYMYNQG
jgi:hypothetical protein